MNKNRANSLYKYAAALLFCGILVWWYLSSRDFAAAPKHERCRMLSDAFLIPGITTVMTGCLIAISNQGGLDGISYALGKAVRMLIPGFKTKDETYSDYVTRKRANAIKGYGFLFVTGGCFLAAAILFMVLFYQFRE